MWENITIEKFNQILNVESVKDTQLYEKEILLLSIITDKSEEYFENLSFEDFKKELNKLNFLKEDIKSNDIILDKFIKIKNRYFKLKINNKELTTNDYINLNSLNKNANDYAKNLHLIVSLFLVEYKSFLFFKIKKRKQDVDEISEFIYKNMSIVDAKNIANFFLTLSEHLIKIMKYSLILKMKKMWKKEKNQNLKQQIQDFIQKIIIE